MQGQKRQWIAISGPIRGILKIAVCLGPPCMSWSVSLPVLLNTNTMERSIAKTVWANFWQKLFGRCLPFFNEIVHSIVASKGLNEYSLPCYLPSVDMIELQVNNSISLFIIDHSDTGWSICGTFKKIFYHQNHQIDVIFKYFSNN